MHAKVCATSSGLSLGSVSWFAPRAIAPQNIKSHASQRYITQPDNCGAQVPKPLENNPRIAPHGQQIGGVESQLFSQYGIRVDLGFHHDKASLVIAVVRVVNGCWWCHGAGFKWILARGMSRLSHIIQIESGVMCGGDQSRLKRLYASLSRDSTRAHAQPLRLQRRHAPRQVSAKMFPLSHKSNQCLHLRHRTQSAT